MSTGRHAKRRAARTAERVAGEQEILLKKEEARKGQMEKDVESQRIATMRARFGGQAPDTIGDQGGAAKTTTPEAQNFPAKFKSPSRLSTGDPMRNTIMSMMFNDDEINNQRR